MSVCEFCVLTLSSLLPLGIEVNFIALAYSQPSPLFVYAHQASQVRFCSSLRPLRSLREVCLRAVMSFFLHADYAESAEFLFSLVYYAGAGGVANFVTTRVRRGEM